MSFNVPESGQVLGIDVGWSEKKKTTGACVLKWDARVVTLGLDRIATADSLQVERLAPGEVLALAVDGPLRGALDEIGVYRDAEMMLTRGFAARIGKPGQSSSGNGRKLNAAANAVVRAALSGLQIARSQHDARIHELAVAEAFPTSFLGVMLDEGCVPAHGQRSDAYYLHLLGPSSTQPPALPSDRLRGLIERLLPGRQIATDLATVQDHEERAALICAVTALCVACRKYVAVGDPENGYIVLPPKAAAGEPGLQPWAWSVIEANRKTNGTARVVVE